MLGGLVEVEVDVVVPCCKSNIKAAPDFVGDVAEYRLRDALMEVEVRSVTGGQVINRRAINVLGDFR